MCFSVSCIRKQISEHRHTNAHIAHTYSPVSFTMHRADGPNVRMLRGIEYELNNLVCVHDIVCTGPSIYCLGAVVHWDDGYNRKHQLQTL